MTQAKSEKSIWYALCPLGFIGLLKGDLKIRSVNETISFPRQRLGIMEVPDFISGDKAGYYNWSLRIIQVNPEDK